MPSVITPLIRKLKKGTFVTFQSTGEDMTFSWNSTTRKIKFSKFALLDIPAIVASTNGVNSIQFNNVEGAFTQGLSTASPPPEGDRVDFSESLQNYLMNMETLLIRSADYKAGTLLTASERLFFKWLKEIGAVRFRTPKATGEKSTTAGTVFVEEDDNLSVGPNNLYNRVIKYIGEVDMESSLLSNTNSFKEIYIYVPTQNGKTPTILFQSIEDDNYYAGQTIKKSDNINVEYIAGRDSSDEPTLAGLKVHALYDMDVVLTTYTYTVNGSLAIPIWFTPMAPSGPNAYFTDAVFGDPANDEIERDDPSSINTVTYIRSRLDGIMIDFNKSDYYLFENNPLLTAFNELNSTALASSFAFNTVLLYYDIWDASDPSVVATNLFGVWFINDLEIVSSGGSKIASLDKIKPNSITREQGNGYGLKLNMKIDMTADSLDFVEVEASVNDYNTFSMQLFSETMQRISEANNNFERLVLSYASFMARLDQIESLILNDANKQQLLMEIETIKEQLTGVIPDTETAELIAELSTKIDEILSGNTTVKLDFLLDLRAFDGLRMALTNKKLSIHNTRQKFTSSTEINLYTGKNQSLLNNVMKLDYADTLIYHKNGKIEKTAAGNVVFYIDDSTHQWKANQVMTVAFVDPIDMQNFGVLIYTDSTNRLGLTDKYQNLVGTVATFTNKNPIIEIICVDDKGAGSFIVLVK